MLGFVLLASTALTTHLGHRINERRRGGGRWSLGADGKIPLLFGGKV